MYTTPPLYSFDPVPMLLTRRTFVRYLGLAASPMALPAYAGYSTRTLKFVHTHTGETLVARYAVNGCYQADCLSGIDRLLRDHRTGAIHTIDPHLLDILFELQVLADCDDAFQIVCGYRSPATNSQLRRKSTGVAEHSLHMEGRAVDVRLGGFPTRRLRDLALSLKRGGVGFYAASDFVHVDTGRVRAW